MTDVRLATHPSEMERLAPEQLRERFLLEDLFVEGALSWALSQQDRVLVGGALPAGGELELTAPAEVAADRLCDRREVGVVCLSGSGSVTADDEVFEVQAEDIVYVSQGTGRVAVSGDAVFYLACAPSHRPHPTTLIRRADAETVALGDSEHANVRTLRKYVHDGGTASSELALGITTIEPGSVWNTLPCHTHDRRTEIYLYFDLPADERVLHVCGSPQRTRSMVVADRQAVISPPWSVHFGAGTSSYKFVWSTAGENLTYTDMDPVATDELR